jgi:hypothetical protein
MRRAPGTVVGVRVAALIALVLLAGGCGLGPLDATQSGGEQAKPVPLLTVLPSPGSLRGPAAQAADPVALQRAFTGAENDALARQIRDRAPAAAAVRTWSGPRGGVLVAAVSVWDSHLTATGVGSDLATMLVGEGGAAWTPQEVPGSRGARIEDPARRELRLAYSVGPNSLYVRATGPVPDATVVKTLKRLILGLQGESAG